MTLYVAATEAEAQFVQAPVLITGIGTLSAAIALTRALEAQRPERVVNFGTAGSLNGRSGIFEISEVCKHDFDTATIEAITGLHIPNRIRLHPHTSLPSARLATGDAFISDEHRRQELAREADLCDMEGYAIAQVCAAYDVPCTLIKQVSDQADAEAAASWAQAVERGARALAQAVANV